MVLAALVLCSLAPLQPAAQGQIAGQLPPAVRGLDVEEHLGRELPFELDFTNSEGKQVHLGDYFKSNKPAVIAMVYFDCPIVCSLVMERIAECVGKLDFHVGKDFQILIFSIDPTETTRQAAELKAHFLTGYNKPITEETRACWQLHTGSSESSRALANALGFRYRALPNGEYSHPVALFYATPDGKISRYIYGFADDPKAMKLALMDASSGRLAKSIGDKALMFCYMYDPKSGSYTRQAVRVMQLGGILTVIGLTVLIGGLFIGERVRKTLRSAAHKSESDQPDRSGGADGQSRKKVILSTHGMAS